MRTLVTSLMTSCSILAAVALGACGGTSDPLDRPGSSGATVSSAPADPAGEDAGNADVTGYFRCAKDDDCVAVRYLTNCCYNGLKIAVNHARADAYLRATECAPAPGHVCPLFILQDTRVPACRESTHQCEMIAGDERPCDGED